MYSFSVLLVRSGLRKADLARALGLEANTVYKWGDEAPRYAIAYLMLFIEVQRYRPIALGTGA